MYLVNKNTRHWNSQQLLFWELSCSSRSVMKAHYWHLLFLLLVANYNFFLLLFLLILFCVLVCSFCLCKITHSSYLGRRVKGKKPGEVCC
jgi:hypothetical protein